MSADANQDERAIARATARLLETGVVLGAASGGFTLLAFVALLGSSARPVWLATAVLGVPAAWYAARVRFDAGLFRDLGASRGDDERAFADRLASLDRALEALGLCRRRNREARALAERVRGARTLIVAQAVVMALQFVLALLAVLRNVAGSTG